MDGFWNTLKWIEDTGLAHWLREGNFLAEPYSAFYTMLGIHSIGMAMVVGVMFMLCMRLLGYFESFPISQANRLMNFAWVGFYINLSSGILLLIAQPRREIMTMTFNLKIIMIVAAVISMVTMQRALNTPEVEASSSADGTAVAVPSRARVAAFVCALFWVGAIISGRLIGYTQPPPPF